jgi:V/A-type H+-transporting ATPase subunit D
MAIKVTPTKANLIKSKNALSFSVKGYDLLDKKRTVLIQEIMSMVSDAEELEKRMALIFAEAYAALQEICISMGLNHVQELAKSIKLTDDFEILSRSVMGVEIPEVVSKLDDKLVAQYGFYQNSPALDNAIMNFNEVKKLCLKLAEIETAAFKLALEIKKTQKRANALDKIKIPELREQIKYIQETIEEKEREDFFRLKIIKKKTAE